VSAGAYLIKPTWEIFKCGGEKAMKNFNWENAEKALDFEIRRAACSGEYLPINELLQNAKIIHDFLCGDSHHFMKAAVEVEEPK
jgi:hypothetical protein